MNWKFWKRKTEEPKQEVSKNDIVANTVKLDKFISGVLDI